MQRMGGCLERSFCQFLSDLVHLGLFCPAFTQWSQPEKCRVHVWSNSSTPVDPRAHWKALSHLLIVAYRVLLARVHGPLRRAVPKHARILIFLFFCSGTTLQLWGQSYAKRCRLVANRRRLDIRVHSSRSPGGPRT